MRAYSHMYALLKSSPELDAEWLEEGRLQITAEMHSFIHGAEIFKLCLNCSAEYRTGSQQMSS